MKRQLEFILPPGPLEFKQHPFKSRAVLIADKPDCIARHLSEDDHVHFAANTATGRPRWHALSYTRECAKHGIKNTVEGVVE